MVLVGSSDLKDARHPVIVRFLERADTSQGTGGTLSLDSGLVGHKDEALAVVFDAIYCQESFVSPSFFEDRFPRIGYLRTKLL